MTDEEVHSAIITDGRVLYSTTLPRLEAEYDKERRKNKIDKGEIYMRSYETKSAAKNPWITFIAKAPSEKKYKGTGTTSFMTIVYYYTTIGIRVFKLNPDPPVTVFNNHVFARYNERLNLNIQNPIDRIKHYFINNSTSIIKPYDDQNDNSIIGITKAGLLLGNWQNDRKWVVYKTFVGWDGAFKDQQEIEDAAIVNLRIHIEEVRKNRDINFSKLQKMEDAYSAIT